VAQNFDKNKSNTKQNKMPKSSGDVDNEILEVDLMDLTVCVFFFSAPCFAAKGGKNRRRGKNLNLERRELKFKEEGQGEQLDCFVSTRFPGFLSFQFSSLFFFFFFFFCADDARQQQRQSMRK
jgi:hypothetical protein